MTSDASQDVFLFPLSPAQRRLWVLHQLDPADPAYHVPLALRLIGALDVGALEAALRGLVERHEILRTTFAVQDDEPCQLVHPAGTLTLAVEDIAGPAALDDRMRAEAAKPFDLTRGPVIRAVLFRLAPDHHVLLATLHHIACDGWSLGVMVRELAALYAGAGDALGEVTLHYADYVEWQGTGMSDEVLAPQIAHWKTELTGAPTVLELPADRPQSPVPAGTGGTVRRHLPAALSDRLNKTASRQGATPFMVALASWAVLLNRLTGAEDLLIGTPVANRHHGGFEDVVGFFVNTLAIRCRLDGNPTVAGLIGRIRRSAVDAYANQDLPFERLVELAGVGRDSGRSPLIQTMLAVQNTPLGRIALPGLDVEVIRPDTGSAKLDLTLILEPDGDTLLASLEYAADRFQRSTAERMLDRWFHLLDRMVGTPDARLSTLDILAPSERDWLVREVNAG
ncbi:condensation domain-containing protein, partial [Skermanella aerolata]